MKKSIRQRLAEVPVLPIIQANQPDVAVDIAKSLKAGGITVVEVVLRTPEALDCLVSVVRGCNDMVVGAGTVLNTKQADAAIKAGAQFLVSPGLDDEIVKLAVSREITVFPGVTTPSEAMRALNLGLNVVKFFPAAQAGGPAMLTALGSVFSQLQFMPTGGVSAGNLADYLAIPTVLACGGSWLTPKGDVAAGDFAVITRLAREALAIATKIRGAN